VRKISSPKRVASVPNLCNGQGQWGGNILGKRELLWFWQVSLPVQFQEVQHDWGAGTHWKLRATPERKSERSQISQKNFGWRNAGALERLERRARANWESVKKMAFFQMGVTPFQAMNQC